MYYRQKIIYKRSKILGGYALKVHDDIGFKTILVHICQEDLQNYLKKFGNTIINERSYLEWWCKKHEIKNY